MVGFKLVHRMILGELAKVFILTLTGLTTLLLLAGLVAEASHHGMTPGQILTVIPLLLPNMMPYILPTATLFATCTVYGRLAADNEILAIKAAGVHIVHVVWPAVLLGLGASAITVVLYYDLIPSTHHTMRARVFDDMEEYLYGILRKEGRLQHPRINYTINVRQVEGRILRDAQFMRLDPKTRLYDIVARADQAQLTVDREKKLLWVHMRNCTIINNKDDAHVEEKAWPVELPADFDTVNKLRASDMSWPELNENRSAFQNQSVQLRDKLNELKAQMHQAGASSQLQEQIKGLEHQVRELRHLTTSINVEKHMRPALAMGCLCFVLIGCPVGIWFSRSDFLSGFITCFLPIIIVYYPLLLSSLNMARSLQMTPWIVWTANLTMVSCAAILFQRLARN